METEKGVYAVVYKQKGRSPRFLVLKRKRNWEGWETPKGHLEEDDYRKTVKIELEEEAGIEEEEIEEIEDMDEEVSWSYEDDGEEKRREFRAFLVKVSEDAHPDVSRNPDEEHERGFFLNYEDAKGLLTHDDNVEILEEANQRIGK